MKLYIDGDALPNRLKKILYRAIQRHALQTVVVSNKRIDIGSSNYITYIVVASGPDEADDRIVALVQEHDLVITSDIPLADRVIAKSAYAIDHRGTRFTLDNIKQYLAMRDLMQELRDMGEQTKGPPPFTDKDANLFANQLDRLLTKYKNLI